MTNPKSCIVAAVAGALSMGAVAWAAEPNASDLKIQQLEAKVAALEAKQAQNGKDVAATIDAVLRDAEKRSQLLAAGDSMAGYDNGFFIRSGAWSIQPGVLFQFWNDTRYRSDSNDGDHNNHFDNGFEVHRLQFILEGTAINKDITYRFNWDSGGQGHDGGSMVLEDAWVRWMFADQWGARMGQFKELLTHEWLTNDGYLLAAERSMVDHALGGQFLDRTQGVSLVYGGYDRNNPFNAEIAFTDGLNQDNTNYQSKIEPFSPAGPHSFDFGITGRAEYKVMGDWKDYKDQSAMGTKNDLLVLGAGMDWSQSGDGDVITAAIDAQWEMASGLSVYGGFIYRWLDGDIIGADDDSSDYGLVVQAGYLLNPSWELFGRYDWLHLDNNVSTASGDEDNFHEFTVGVNYFMGANGSAGHRAKFTVDLSYYPNGTPGGVFDTTRIGATGESTGDDEWVLRGQFQLMI